MGASSHFSRIVNGRFWIYRHVIHTHDDGLPPARKVFFDLYDPVNDIWLGCFDSFALAFAACREATRKEFF